MPQKHGSAERTYDICRYFGGSREAGNLTAAIGHRPHMSGLRRLLRDTSHQLIQSRKEKLQDGRLVRLSVAEDKIDGWRNSLQRTTRYGRKEKILCVSRQ